ncbi:MAG: zinc ribbon domain-containing protein [Terriglobales bacterium]
MNPDIQNLKDLQDADREVSRLSQEIADLPKRVAAIEAQLAASKARKEKASTAIKAGEGVRRKLETQIQDLQQKISKYRDQMLAVKTNQEYKALTHEVEFAQQQIREAEDKILESMVSAELQEKDLKAAEAELKQETAEIEKEKAEARARTEEDQKQLADWNARRSKLRTAITADVLRHYDRVLKLRGSALAEAVDHKCSACQVMLRPQMYNDVRTNEQFIICDSCHRILWYDPARDVAPAKQEAEVAAETAPPSGQ